MSAAEPVAEPSMEEILASIRKAISEDHALSQQAESDPFGADSNATVAFSAPPEGKSFDANAHARHDPFAELNAKLDERREKDEHSPQRPAPSSARQAEPPVRPAAMPPLPPQTQPSQTQPPRTQPPRTQPPQMPAPRPLSRSQPEARRETAAAPAVPPSRQGDHEAAARPASDSSASGSFKPFSAAFAEGAKKQASSKPSEAQRAISEREARAQHLRAVRDEPEPVKKPTRASAFQAEFRSQNAAQNKDEARGDWRASQSQKPGQLERSAAGAGSPEEGRNQPVSGLISEQSRKSVSTALRRARSAPRLSKMDGVTVEELVGQLLEPLLKDWLDANLPSLVEEILRDELRQVSNR